jgi:L-alanine-DL-glutamate epimerase-like enolase superfamily enzyme
LIRGEDPRDLRRLFRKIQMACSGAGSVAGAVYHAISGIEAALWDLAGQRLGVPMYTLLGGKFRDRIRIYADCHAGTGLESLDAVLRTRRPSWAQSQEIHAGADFFEETTKAVQSTPEMYGARAKAMAQKGFTALKFDIDIPNPFRQDLYNRCLTNREIDYLLSLVAGAREAVPLEIDIAVDCHWRFNVNDACKLAVGCEPFRLLWLEDPVDPRDTTGLVEVKTSTRTPIASGENLYLFEGFHRLLDQGALSIASPDLQKVGGLSEGRRIAELADSCSVVVAPHNISSPVGTLASAHFCASIPNFLALEFHASDVPFWSDLVEGIPKPIIKDGFISLPEKPGLGVTLNEEVARRFARAGEPFFE